MRNKELRFVRDDDRIPIIIIVCAFGSFFALLLLVMWVLLDVGIADRVVITLTLVPLLLVSMGKTIETFGERRKRGR